MLFSGIYLKVFMPSVYFSLGVPTCPIISLTFWLTDFIRKAVMIFTNMLKPYVKELDVSNQGLFGVANIWRSSGLQQMLMMILNQISLPLR